jgi:hypothetical protein
LNTTDVQFPRPEASASTIASRQQQTYDVFAHVCQSDTYIPNERARNFTEIEVPPELVSILRTKMMENWLENESFRNVRGGSETLVVDRNLQNILSTVQTAADNYLGLKSKLKVKKLAHPASSNYLQSSMVPEHCYTYSSIPKRYSFIVVGSEAKSLEASIRMCYSQLISLCGSAAIDLVKHNVPVENAVVPGIAIAGDGIQICLVYLLKPFFPVFTAVSKVLNPLGSFAEQSELAAWLIRCYIFGADTVQHIERSSNVVTSINLATLSLSLYFLKPIRAVMKELEQTVEAEDEVEANQISTYSANLNHLMHIYKLLHSELGEEAQRMFLFPEGVISGLHNEVATT